jgi:hypothetical protein
VVSRRKRAAAQIVQPRILPARTAEAMKLRKKKFVFMPPLTTAHPESFKLLKDCYVSPVKRVA